MNFKICGAREQHIWLVLYTCKILLLPIISNSYEILELTVVRHFYKIPVIMYCSHVQCKIFLIQSLFVISQEFPQQPYLRSSKQISIFQFLAESSMFIMTMQLYAYIAKSSFLINSVNWNAVVVSMSF